jgi:cysteine desulfuration protein SufE
MATRSLYMSVRRRAMTLDEIIDGFEFLDDWDDRYRFLIELGRMLPPFAEEERSPRYKVEGCASQVWLVTERNDSGGEPSLTFRGDSDAHLVRGLIAVLLALYSGRTPREILATDAQPVLDRIGLGTHLTPQRSNGVRAMVTRIKDEASAALGTEAATSAQM